MCWEKLDKYRDVGMLILRVGIGAMFVCFGYNKLAGGAAGWEKIGSALSFLRINFAPQFFGLIASLVEFVGGICLILGLYMRPACVLLFVVMFVAAVFHFGNGDGLQGAAHAINMAVVFLSLMITGPGDQTLNTWMKCCRKK